MFVLVNPYAAGGRARRRWGKVREELSRQGMTMYEHVIADEGSIEAAVRSACAAGERHFIAAGGDGTVNALLNAVMRTVGDAARKEVCLGGIGLGSSNDFHKPYEGRNRIYGFPVCMDADRARPRDIGRLSIVQSGASHTRYFLVNASIGITADANALFSNPTFLLRKLKRVSTPLSIAFAAAKTIASARNIRVILEAGEGRSYNVNLTNLAVLKSPYISGRLKFPGNLEPSNGLFSVNLNHSLSRIDLLHLLFSLAIHRPGDEGNRSLSFTSPRVRVVSNEALNIEFDGETIRSHEAEFSLLPEALNVCR